MMIPDISLKGIWFAYDDEPVLRDVTFDIGHNNFTAMVGPNGGGKTTLVKLMLGLLTPSSGTVKVFGGDPVRSRQRMGYVPQFGSMDNEFPIIVNDVVSMGLVKIWDLFPFFGRESREKVRQVLALLNISELGERPFGSLSGGQKQRCLIARAIISGPDVLIHLPTSRGCP